MEIEDAYNDCKEGKLISWVKIGPWSPLLLKFLFDFVHLKSWKNKRKK